MKNSNDTIWDRTSDLPICSTALIFAYENKNLQHGFLNLYCNNIRSGCHVVMFVSSGATALQGFGRQSGRRRSAKLVPTFAYRGVSRGQRNGSPRPLISVYRTWIATYFIQVAPHLISRGWVYPVPDPLPLRKSGSAGNRTRDLCTCSQKLWPLDHRGGHVVMYVLQ
jgi:hypothetical protein